jgi:hypothetical protein
VLLFEERDSGAEGRGRHLREGHEFRDQGQIPSDAQGGGTVVPVVGPAAVRLVKQVVRELLLIDVTGQMPGGKDWGSQPWWRVDLWEAFWRGRAQAQASHVGEW